MQNLQVAHLGKERLRQLRDYFMTSALRYAKRQSQNENSHIYRESPIRKKICLIFWFGHLKIFIFFECLLKAFLKRKT